MWRGSKHLSGPLTRNFNNKVTRTVKQKTDNRVNNFSKRFCRLLASEKWLSIALKNSFYPPSARMLSCCRPLCLSISLSRCSVLLFSLFCLAPARSASRLSSVLFRRHSLFLARFASRRSLLIFCLYSLYLARSASRRCSLIFRLLSLTVARSALPSLSSPRPLSFAIFFTTSLPVNSCSLSFSLTFCLS